MKVLKCGNCGKSLTTDMEVEYSTRCCEYFCSPDCATDFYFNYMGSCCIDIDNLEDDIIVKNNKFYKQTD